MFDNFGLGEFFFLALLALLFFGPERLPQIGAKLGRWVGKLTQYSKAFMNEWREEALVIHDAVAEVKGIRDEIVAAQAEISSTLETARGDMQEGVDVAKDAVTGARTDVVQRIQNQRRQAAADFERIDDEDPGVRSSAGPDGEAIDKTQAILDDLETKRREAELAEGHDKEWLRNRRAIDELMNRNEEKGLPRSAFHPPEKDIEKEGKEAVEAQDTKADRVQDKAGRAVAGAAAAAELQESTEAAAPEQTPDEAPPAEPQESAFDRTQSILDELRRKRGQLPPEEKIEKETIEQVKPVPDREAEGQTTEAPAADAEDEPEKETAFERTQKILDDFQAKRQSKTTAAQPVEEAVQRADIDRAEFEQLNLEVDRLQDEMAALRQEMRALLAAADRGDGASETTSDGLSVEEVA